MRLCECVADSVTVTACGARARLQDKKERKEKGKVAPLFCTLLFGSPRHARERADQMPDTLSSFSTFLGYNQSFFGPAQRVMNLQPEALSPLFSVRKLVQTAHACLCVCL